MAIVVNPSIPLVVAPNTTQGAQAGATTNIALQTGTVINARVLQILGSNQVQISIAGQSIDVQSQVPLQAGQTLQLAVSQGSDGSVLLAVVPQGDASASPGSTAAATAGAISDTVTLAPEAAATLAAQPVSTASASTNQLTALEAIAVSGAAQNAAIQQASLAPLFANLEVAAGLNGLPPQVQQAVAQLLSQRTSLDPNLGGDDIKQAFQSSGLFLEASLASGSASLSSTTPDLKAALIVLRQVLTTSLGDAQATQSATTPTTTTSTTTTANSGAATSATATAAPTTTAATTLAAAAAGTSPATALEAAVLPQGAAANAEALTQPITIIADPATTASPSLVPSLASEAAALEALSSGETSTPPQEIIDVAVTNGIAAQPSAPADAAARTAASSAALNLLQEVVQANPLTVASAAQLGFDSSQMLSLLPVLTAARLLGADNSGAARSKSAPPPIGGALPAAQPVAGATLVSGSSSENVMHRLLDDTDGAIARQTLLQIASLPDRADAAGARIDPTIPRWNFEIPFATPQGTAMAQFEISRDGGNQDGSASTRVWRARFSLDVEPTGPIHALISLNGDKTSVRMWAERPATADQLRANSAQLTQALSQAELRPGDIVIRDGAPPQSAPAPAGHFLDRAL